MRAIPFVTCLLSIFLAISANGASGLNILLTNDDGYDSEGIQAVLVALTDAGHKVVIVAPTTQQSATGMKVTLGGLSIFEHEPEVWSVSGSPADSVMIGLSNVFGERKPDLVVSGANFGQNLGSNVMLSGTVGAAAMSVLMGVPAIALSVGLDLSESNAKPTPYASTIATFPEAAQLLVTVLQQYLNDPTIIPNGELLNINYPVGGPLQPSILATMISNMGGFVINHVGSNAANNAISAKVSQGKENDGVEHSDVAAFSGGNITISFLKPDWNSSKESLIKLDGLAQAIYRAREQATR
jgi:5'-nucleotidase